ncbi:MAG: hypothetical protein WD794_09550 [Mycobacteriales bacterium]
MTSKTIVRAGLVTAGALTAAVLAGTAAQAATAGQEHRDPGMDRMHERMMQTPGMDRMHERMQEGTTGMPMMQMGPATR